MLAFYAPLVLGLMGRWKLPGCKGEKLAGYDREVSLDERGGTPRGHLPGPNSKEGKPVG